MLAAAGGREYQKEPNATSGVQGDATRLVGPFRHLVRDDERSLLRSHRVGFQFHRMNPLRFLLVLTYAHTNLIALEIRRRPHSRPAEHVPPNVKVCGSTSRGPEERWIASFSD
ncbi:unnamed protein product [Heligmosomoides polygyrus]|uniref:Uncharacterized protein n=1 Tax=Heligmosomoides polygyrus TaxID=6339 RepID=A0A183FU87_HELPZ|nr:unnamed protein product [Heligmosomoides polygyrus]